METGEADSSACRVTAVQGFLVIAGVNRGGAAGDGDGGCNGPRWARFTLVWGIWRDRLARVMEVYQRFILYNLTRTRVDEFGGFIVRDIVFCKAACPLSSRGWPSSREVEDYVLPG